MVFERYTKRAGDQILMTDVIDGKYTEHELIGVLLQQLACYEDTGLTPEGVKDLQFRSRAAELSAGASLHHVIDLVQAEKAGRLLILPCQVGSTVYVLADDDVHEATVWNIESYRNARGELVVLFVCGTAGTFALEDWGKTVFQDEKQALHALAVSVTRKLEAVVSKSISSMVIEQLQNSINDRIAKEE